MPEHGEPPSVQPEGWQEDWEHTWGEVPARSLAATCWFTIWHSGTYWTTVTMRLSTP